MIKCHYIPQYVLMHLVPLEGVLFPKTATPHLVKFSFVLLALVRCKSVKQVGRTCTLQTDEEKRPIEEKATKIYCIKFSGCSFKC